MYRQRILLWSAFIMALSFFALGCVPSLPTIPSPIYAQNPPLAKKVHKIVKGETTKAEIIHLFGDPDYMADGADIKLHRNSLTGKKWADYQKWMADRHNNFRKKVQELQAATGEEEAPSSNPFHDKNSNPFRDSHSFDKLEKSRPYSSIDDEHIAFLYLESYDTLSGFCLGPILFQSSTNLENRLLIFINKKTDIVDEFAFREQFKVD